MAASVIPPPIVQSTYASPPAPVAQSVAIKMPSPLQHRQGELEADLQFLLDAQAEGLVRGLEGGLSDDHTSTGSTTPTAQSVRSTSARRAAQPVRRKPGLRSARKGIHNSILALSAVKDEELYGLGDDVREKDQTLEQIDEWEKKRRGLQEAQTSVESNEDTVRVQRLQQEADALQQEINAVELQLLDMRTRRRKITRKVAAIDNSVQAKMASYTSSLRMLEEDVQKFLFVSPTETSTRAMSQDGKASMWQLPPKRRTLDMARQQWTEEREIVVRQCESVEHEKAALNEGAALWKDVVSQLTNFERRLRMEMTKQSAASSDSGASDGLREVFDHMQSLTETLETKLELAKGRSWNLLIAAIGAELDALKQGRQLLENVLGITVQQSQKLVDTQDGSSGDPRSSDGDEIRELDKSFETARRRRVSSTDSEDEPDPELLFSKQDTDTE